MQQVEGENSLKFGMTVDTKRWIANQIKKQIQRAM